MEIYKYESIEAVNHGMNKLEAMGWEIIDVDVRVITISNTTVKEIFYVFVEKVNSGGTFEKSLIPTESIEDDL